MIFGKSGTRKAKINGAYSLNCENNLKQNNHSLKVESRNHLKKQGGSEKPHE